MGKKKTTQQYIEEMKTKNPNIEILTEYNGVDNPIKVRCLLDDYEWWTSPHNLSRGKGCPKCKGNAKKTQQEFVSELYAINPDIKVLGEYINSQTKIKVECQKDGYIWSAKPTHLLAGHGCPLCSGRARWENESFAEYIATTNPNVELLSDYVNMQTKIKCCCKIDGTIFETSPARLKSGGGCPTCQKNLVSDKMKMHKADYESRLHKIHPLFEVGNDYVNFNTPCTHTCKNCGFTWVEKPSNVIRIFGCQNCNKTRSRGEDIVEEWMMAHNINYVRQYTFEDCKDIRPLPFDFYTPDYNSCIEFDGPHHFEPIKYSLLTTDEQAAQNLEVTQRHDEIKNMYCKDNNIRLLRIPYYKNIGEELNNFIYLT